MSTEVPTAAAALPEQMTREEIRGLMSRLSDAEVRELLIRQLDKAAVADEAPDAGFIGGSEVTLNVLREKLALMLEAVPRLPEIGPVLMDHVSAGQGAGYFGLMVLGLLLMAAVGLVVERLFLRLLPRIGGAEGGTRANTLTGRFCIQLVILVRDFLGIVVFGVAVISVFFLLDHGHEPTRQVITAVVWAILIIRGVAALSRFAVAPRASALRLPPLDDATAGTLHRQVTLIAGTITVGYFFGECVHAGLADPDPGFVHLMGRIISVVAVCIIVAVVWSGRETVARLLAGGDAQLVDGPGRARRMVAGKWHIIVTWFLIGLLLISTAQELITGEDVIGAVIASLLIFVALPIVDWLMGVVFARLLGVSGPAPGETEPATAAADQTEDSTDDGEQPLSEHAIAMRLQYRDVLVRNFRIVLGVLGVLVLAGLWDIDIRDFAASGVGETVAAALVDIVITLILASAVWGIVKTAIQQAAASDEADHEAHEAGDMGGKGGTRLQTLVPLFGRFLLVTITVIVTLIILSELGVDIGPLIAGAGVVGLAVGFGAQTLVKDILSGVFFLIDDAFRVGEYVVIGEVRGMVEHISIRSLRLRHHRGPVHTIPFGEIRHLTNYSRDWAIMKLEMRLPFDTDLEKVRKLVKKVGQEMMDDPVHGPNFLQPVKSQGVNRMDDSAFIVRVKFMAKPGEQFTLRREVFRRIQESFAENGAAPRHCRHAGRALRRRRSPCGRGRRRAADPKCRFRTGLMRAAQPVGAPNIR